MGARREITQAAADKQMRDLGVMVNAGGRVPIDESPDCYKPAEEVIRAVTDAGLAEVEVRCRPSRPSRATTESQPFAWALQGDHHQRRPTGMLARWEVARCLTALPPPLPHPLPSSSS